MVYEKKQLSKKILAIAASIAIAVAFMPMFGNFAYAADEYDYTVTSPTSVEKTYTGGDLDVSEDLAVITINTGAELKYGEDFTAEVSTNDVTDNGQILFTTTGSTYGGKTIAPIALKVVEPEAAADTYTADVDTTGLVYAGEQANPAEYVAGVIKAGTVVVKNKTEKVDFDVEVTPDSANTTAKGFAGEKYAYEIKVAGVKDAITKGTATIAKVNLSTAEVATKTGVSVDYTGAAQEPELGVLTVKNVGELAADAYTATYSNNINAGKEATATITAKDTVNFTGTAKVNFTINPLNVATPFIDVTAPKTLTYNGKVQTPAAADLGVKVYVEDSKLAAEVPAGDYNVKCVDENSKDVGKYQVTIEASDSGNVTFGTVKAKDAYEIVAANIDAVTVTPLKSSIEVGTDVVADFATYFKVMLGEVELKAGTDFDVSYAEGSSKDAIGNVKLNLQGKNNLTGKKEQTYTNAAKALAPIYTSAYSAVYDATAKTPTEGTLGELTKKDAKADGADKLTKDQYEITGYEANKNAGTAIAKIKGKGEYAGVTADVEFAITPAALPTGLKVSGIAAGTYYTGCEITDAAVTYGTDGTLAAADCTVTAKTIADGYLTAVTVTGKGNYEGSSDVTLDPKVASARVSLDDATVEGTIPAGLKDTSVATLQSLLTVKVGDAVLTNDVYTVDVAGTYELGKELTLTLTPTKEEIKGSKTVKMTVVAGNITALKDAFAVADGNVYTGKALEPAVTYTALKDTLVADLVKDKDYTVTYANNTNAGTAKATITGKGNYAGTFDLTFEIAKAKVTAADFQISTADVASNQMEYHAGAITAVSGLKVEAVKGKDYVFAADDYTLTLVAGQKDVAKGEAVKYDVKIVGDNYEAVTIEGVEAYKVKAKQIAAGTAAITLQNSSIAYTGKDVDLTALGAITVTIDGINLVKDTDFTAVVKGVTNKVTDQVAEKDKPYVEITFAGNYAGLDKRSFAVVALEGPDFANLVFKDTTASYYYDGTAKAQEVSYIGKGDAPAADTYTVVYSKAGVGDTPAVALENAPADVGNYIATIKTSDAYGAVAVVSKSFKIEPKNITKTEFDKMTSDLEVGKMLFWYESEDNYDFYGEDPAFTAGTYKDQFKIDSVEYKAGTWDKTSETGIGIATVSLKADANYAISDADTVAKIEFEIYDHEDVSDFEPSDFFAIDPQTYTGKALTPELKAIGDLPVEYAEVKSYSENTNVSTMTAKAYVVVTVPKGIAKYRAGTFKGDVVFTINPAPIADQTITVAKATYAGKAVTPKVTIKDADGTPLKNTEDYKVAYSNNTKAGKGTATITGIKNYTGETEVQFTINKGVQKITKVTPASKTYKANKKTKKLAKTYKFTLKATATPAKGGGKVTFKKANKVGGAKVVVAKTGKVTVKTGLKKGTYKVKVKATKAANANYKVATKTVTVKIIVK